MKLLLQRVLNAQVTVNQNVIGQISQGVLVFVGFEKNDCQKSIAPMVKKLLHYRFFSDDNDKMNHNVQQASGELLIVSQFTLAADTKKGLRPSFSSASPPDIAKQLYLDFVEQTQQSGLKVETGEFGADMQVSLTNDGPVTFMLEHP